jgi:hypothetical protein
LERDDEPADVRRVSTTPRGEYHVGDLTHGGPVGAEERQADQPRDIDQTLRHLAKLAPAPGAATEPALTSER